jgi:hypothetical protein
MADGPIVLKLRPTRLLRSGAQRRERIRDGSVGVERMSDQRSALKQGPQLIEAETGSASVSKEVDVAAVGRRTSAKKSSHRIGSPKGSIAPRLDRLFAPDGAPNLVDHALEWARQTE